MKNCFFSKIFQLNPRGCSVLVIDDSPGNLLWTKKVLSKKGYQVLTASDGADGIALARRERPDVIILDCLMPGLSGIEVCSILKADQRTKDIPILFLTVVEDGDHMIQCYECGAECYLTKPINARELISEIEFTLEK